MGTLIEYVCPLTLNRPCLTSVSFTRSSPPCATIRPMKVIDKSKPIRKYQLLSFYAIWCSIMLLATLYLDIFRHIWILFDAFIRGLLIFFSRAMIDHPCHVIFKTAATTQQKIKYRSLSNYMANLWFL
jgi:hypothetical protein